MPGPGRIEQWNAPRGRGVVPAFASPAAAGDPAALAHAGRGSVEPPAPAGRTRRRPDATGPASAAGAGRGTPRRRNAAGIPARHHRAPLQDRLPRAVLAVALLALAAGSLLQAWPPAVTVAYAAMGLASFLAYRHDKRAAASGRQRTPESTLHLLDLCCGWPGGLLAQQRYRHKTRKLRFQCVFWLTLLLNCAALLWLLPALSSPP